MGGERFEARGEFGELFGECSGDGQSAKDRSFFSAEDFSAVCKLLMGGGFRIWVELPVR